MARCNDCNKFVSYGDIETEIQDERVDDDAVTVEVRVALTCADCGGELKETTLEFEQGIDHDCDGAEVEGDRYEIISSDAQGSDRQQTVDAKGKPVNPRYAKTYYGADVTVELKCARCGETFEVSGHVEEQASAFEELY